MIKTVNLCKNFGDLIVFKDIYLNVQKGECIAVIGPSGTGKSVLFRTLTMLEKPDSGQVLINGTDITGKGVNINKVREKFGMVYQGFHLFSHLNVLDNITLAPRKVKKMSRPEAEKRAMELLNMVGLSDKSKSYPHQLSGGQQQRVAIARSLAMDPDIILFDEPTSALDPSMTGEVLTIIRKLAMSGLTMMISTHEMGFAQDVASRVIYMDDKGIYEEGTPDEIFMNPQKEKTRMFIRKLKVFTYSITSRGFDMVSMNVQIEMFCQKYNVESKKINHIQLILEELIVSVIERYPSDSQLSIEFTIEFSEERREIQVAFIYKGELFNPFEIAEGSDHLGMTLITGVAKSFDHKFENGQNTININL
ncbi:MAG: ATP-binding cassette domain-containing protein [Bacteroidales bacterium]|nr:ATP-binding cassette domain-containing protein [Bacteroidales bacterium]